MSPMSPALSIPALSSTSEGVIHKRRDSSLVRSEPISIPSPPEFQDDMSYSSSFEAQGVKTMSNEHVLDRLLGDDPTIWVFGYGSLLWKPDFSYKSKRIGYIDGYVRRFYQGNITFRGKPGKPGRVANLVEEKEGCTWGVAYEISGRHEVEEVLKGLYAREAVGGGYTTKVTTFYPREMGRETSQGSFVPPASTSERDSSKQICDCSLSSPVQFHLGDLEEESEENSEREKYNAPAKMEVETHPRLRKATAAPYCSKSLSTGVKKSKRPFSSCSNLSGLSLEAKSLATLHAAIYRSPSDSALNLGGFDSFEFDQPPESSRSPESHFLPHQHLSRSVSESHDSSRAPLLHTENRDNPAPIQVLLYTAVPSNDLYLGEDDLDAMARQVVDSVGHAGTNVEYVVKTADFIRKYIPEDNDPHLFQLDAKVREEVYRRGSAHAFILYDHFNLSLEIEAKPVVSPVQAS